LQFAGSPKEGEDFDTRGVNVWDQGWQVVPGEEETIRFAAGEFSRGEWGMW
jgi:hypothetical protein